MTVGLGPNGITIKRLPEILSELNTGLQEVYGKELDLDPSSPQGQHNAIMAEDLTILYETAEALFVGLHPDFSSGAMLDLVSAIRGVTRKGASPTTATVTFTGTAGTVVPIGTLFTSTGLEGVSFVLQAQAAIDGQGIVRADVNGPLQLPAGTLTGIATPVAGLTTVNNLADGIPGNDIETDAAFRLRSNLSVAYPAVAIIEAMYAGIANLSGVTQVIVYENDTDTIDPDTGVNPKSMHAVVLGGVDNDIAEVIFNRKSLGCGMDGTTTVAVTDSVGIDHDINFSHPSTVPIHVEVTVKEGDDWDASQPDKIKQAIVDYGECGIVGCTGFIGYRIGQDVLASELYQAVTGSTAYDVNEILVGDVTATGIVVDIGAAEIASFDVIDIDVVNIP